MVKAVISFEYNPEAPEEVDFVDDLQNGSTYKSVLWDFDQYLRGILKHGDPSSVKLEDVRVKLWELLRENGVEFL